MQAITLPPEHISSMHLHILMMRMNEYGKKNQLFKSDLI